MVADGELDAKWEQATHEVAFCDPLLDDPSIRLEFKYRPEELKEAEHRARPPAFMLPLTVGITIAILAPPGQRLWPGIRSA